MKENFEHRLYGIYVYDRNVKPNNNKSKNQLILLQEETVKSHHKETEGLL